MRTYRTVLATPRDNTLKLLICVRLAGRILCAAVPGQFCAWKEGTRKPKVQMVPLPADYRIDLQMALLSRQSAVCILTKPHNAEREVEIPYAKVDLPKIIARLSELNFYEGQITIEREISPSNQRASVKREIAYLRKVIES